MRHDVAVHRRERIGVTAGAGHGMPHVLPGRSLFGCHTLVRSRLVALASRRRGTGRCRRQGGEEAEAHVDGATWSPRCPRRRRRTSAASAARASRRPRSALRRTSRPTKHRIRTITTYCNGGTRTVLHDQAPRRSPRASRPTPPSPVARAAPKSRSGSRCCTTTTASPSTSSATRSPTTAASPASRPSSTACARRPTQPTPPPRRNKGTVFVSSGDNFLAGLNLRASFQRFDAGPGPFYDSDAIAALGYDAVTIGNHEYDFGPARLAEFIAVARAAARRSCRANTDFSGEPMLQTLRNNGRIADSMVVEQGRRADRHHRRLPAGDADDLLARATSSSTPTSRTSSTRRPQRLTAAGVNKIILSSHLQDTANERAVVDSCSELDIVISGGADDLLANPGDPLVPVAELARSGRLRTR